MRFPVTSPTRHCRKNMNTQRNCLGRCRCRSRQSPAIMTAGRSCTRPFPIPLTARRMPHSIQHAASAGLIRLSTAASYRRMECACSMRTRWRRCSNDIRERSSWQRVMSTALRRPSSRASLPPFVPPANRQLRSNSNCAGQRSSGSNRRPSICTLGSPARTLEAWLPMLYRPANSLALIVMARPIQRRLGYKRLFLPVIPALSSVTFSAYIPCAGATRLWR